MKSTQQPNFNTVVSLWKDLSKEIDASKLHIELEVYKKLLNFFQVGDYYYLIFNVATVTFDLISPNIETILGYQASEVDVNFWFHKIHPEDQIWFANFEQETANFLYQLPKEKLFNYKIQYDLRFQRKDGKYVRLLIQVITLQQYDDGGVYKTLSLHTDITHIKASGKPILSFIGLEGEPSFIDIQIGKHLAPYKQILSRREKEILKLIIEGRQAKEIAEILIISKQTVDTHRNNMIRKTNCKNTAELIGTAIKNAWI